jgi:hypothetical protein
VADNPNQVAGRFRKKPVVIDAAQLIARYNFGTVAAWVNDNGGDAQINMFDPDEDFLIGDDSKVYVTEDTRFHTIPRWITGG